MSWNVKQMLNKLFFPVLLVFFTLSFTTAQAETENLSREIEVIEKLYKDGVLTKEEYERTKKILIRNDKNKEKKLKENPEKNKVKSLKHQI